jgi:hypothetical protein
MLIPQTVDLTIYQGATFKKSWKIVETGTTEAIDLSGYTARMQVREKIKSPEFYLELTTANGGITITVGEEDTTIDLYIDAETTAGITAARGVYDLEIIDTSGEVFRLMQGKVTVSPEVTR